MINNEMLSVDELMNNSLLAAAEFMQFSQEKTDKIVKAIAEAAFAHRVSLAKMAVEETQIGKWEDKVFKNVLTSQLLYHDIINEKTVGIINENLKEGIVEIARPLGPILAIIPVTNPTSTTIFKIIISIKTRNSIIVCPSKKAINCCSETAKICYEAALKAGAPEGCIQWITEVTREQTHALMSHKKLALILATGGGGLVNAAYSSGTPSIGVGAGNVPVYIEKSADIPFSVEQIVISKTFDNGTVCASEQSLVVEESISETVIDELKKKKAAFLNEDEKIKLENLAYDKEKKLMNSEFVGKSAYYIATKAGIEVEPDTTLLLAKMNTVGESEPLSNEILAPILGFYVVNNFDAAIKKCIELNYFGGKGHTVSIFSNDEEKIKIFAQLMNAGRIVVNTPSSQGAVGYTYNNLPVSLTLGCGTGGKNITTDNVTAKHLLNIQRIARRRVNPQFEKFDKSKYYDESFDFDTVVKKYNQNR